MFPTAGAPLSDTIVEFLHTCGINIVVGYGLSETTATVTCYPSLGYEIGTVGTVMPRIQIKLGNENAAIKAEISPCFLEDVAHRQEAYGRIAGTKHDKALANRLNI